MLLGLFMNLTNMVDGDMVVWILDGVFFLMWHGQGKQLALHWAKFLNRFGSNSPIATDFQNVYILM